MSTDSATPFDFTTSDGTWRERLLASLRDCGVQRAPRNPVLRWIILIVFLIVLFLVTIGVRKLLEENLRTTREPILQWLPYIVWYIIAVFLLARARNWFVRKAWQSTAATAEDELLKPGARRPILYLRSFKLDERINRRTFSERFLGNYPEETAEQAMTKTLKAHGPTIAIGRPGEELPSLGAARFYVTDDKWQQKVTDVASEAQFVVWATGSTEGLRWEIEHLVQSVPPEKVIIWAHPHLLHLSPPYRELEWARFRTALGSAFPKPLPETLGEARFIYFTEDWEPHAVAPVRRPIPWLDPVRSSLRGIMAVKTGVDDSRLHRWFARLGKLGIGILIAAIVAAVIAPLLPDHVWTRSEQGQVVSTRSGVNKHQELVMIGSMALALVTASLALGRSKCWRRTRLIVVLLLAVFVAAMAGFAVSGERYLAFEREQQSGGKDAYTKDLVTGKVEMVAMTTAVMTQVVDPWVYVKLALTIAIAIAAVWFTKLGWRSGEIEPRQVHFTDADIAYAGPGNDTFAEMIGAEGNTVDWPRVGVFFGALLAMSIVPSLIVYQSFSPTYSLVRTAIECAVAVIAFRYLRAWLAPLIIAVVVAAAWMVLLPKLGRRDPSALGFSFPEYGRVAIFILAFFAGLSWASRRMGPRPFAFWFGAMVYVVAVLLMRYIPGRELSPMRDKEVMSLLLGPLIFSLTMELGLRFLASRPATASV